MAATCTPASSVAGGAPGAPGCSSSASAPLSSLTTATCSSEGSTAMDNSIRRPTPFGSAPGGGDPEIGGADPEPGAPVPPPEPPPEIIFRTPFPPPKVGAPPNHITTL